MNTEGFPYETWYNMPVYLRRYYVNVIEKRAKELKINLNDDKSWIKPLALQKYIDESTPGFITDIKNLQENGDVL